MLVAASVGAGRCGSGVGVVAMVLLELGLHRGAAVFWRGEEGAEGGWLEAAVI